MVRRWLLLLEVGVVRVEVRLVVEGEGILRILYILLDLREVLFFHRLKFRTLNIIVLLL